MDNAKMIALIAVASIIVAAAYSAIYLLSPPSAGANRYDSLAQCLTGKGTIMYGAETCSACIYQKGLFGDSFKYINYVDCVQQYQVCVNQQIGSFPTWLINGTFRANLLGPEQLSGLSGCSI